MQAQNYNMFKNLTKEYFNKFMTKIDLIFILTEGCLLPCYQKSSINLKEEKLEIICMIKHYFLHGVKILKQRITEKLDWIYLCEIIESSFKKALNLITEENIEPIINLNHMCNLSKKGIIQIDLDDPEFDDYVDKDMKFYNDFLNCFKEK